MGTRVPFAPPFGLLLRCFVLFFSSYVSSFLVIPIKLLKNNNNKKTSIISRKCQKLDIQQKQNSSHEKWNLYSQGSACARDLINPTFMTSTLSFCVSKEQDTASKKFIHCYALDER